MVISGYDIFQKKDPNLKMTMDHDGNYLFYNKNYSKIFDVIEQTALRYPNSCAIVTGSKRYTYNELLNKVHCIAQILWEKNFREGELALLVSESSLNFCLLLLALNKIGTIAVIVSSKLTSTEMEKITADIDFKHSVVNQAQLEKYPFIRSPLVSEKIVSESTSVVDMQKIKNNLSESSGAIQLFTSGTTSKRKRVELSQKHLIHACYSYQYVNKITELDTTIICNPIYHVTALIALFYTFLVSGGTIYLHEKFNVDRLEKNLTQFQITYLHLSPTAYKLFTRNKKHNSFTNIRLIASGSSYLPSEIIRELQNTFPGSNIVSVYGLTETASPGTILHHVEKRENYQSVGYPFPGVDLKIIDDSGNELIENQIGEVYLKGTNIIKHYADDHEKEAFLEGWLATGDIGYLDEDNRLFIVDRAKEMINRGGEKIFTTEIEETLYQFKDIKNCVAIGLPDELYGEIPAAVVTIEKNGTLEFKEVYDYLKKNLSRFKIPQRIFVMDEIPENEAGKFDRNKILKLISEGGIEEWKINV